MNHKLLFVLIFILNFGFIHSFAQKKMNGPNIKKHINKSEIYGSGNIQFLNFYQKWLSPVKGGDTCPMYPSCSQYAKISFQTFPWYAAYPESMQRILRCGHELYLYKTINLKHGFRWYDPVTIQYPNKINDKIKN